MPEDINANGGDESAAPAQEDVLKNIKAEFARKQQNTELTLKQIQDSHAQLLESLNNLSSKIEVPAKQVEEEDLDPYDPQYGKKVAEKVKRELRQEQEQQRIVESKIAQQRDKVLGDIRNLYPESIDPTSDLHKKAAEIYDSYSPSDKANPISLKSAVLEAATELGVLPVSKRKKEEDFNDDDESFTVSSSRSRRASKETKDKKSKLSDQTLRFAELMGLDTSDEKVVKKIEDRASSRKRWNRYE